jgi:hypothetical protein
VPARPRLVITVSATLLVAVLLIVSATTKAQTSQPYTQVIVNLENGQQYFGAPLVYQGDYNGYSTNQWPVYYGPSTASQYWGTTGINQPVLELVPAQHNSAGAMFWSEAYSGGPVSITIIGTYSSVSSVADGFEIYLFLNPTTWGVSPKYNYSIPYTSTAGNGWAIPIMPYPSPVEGDVILPQSSTPYIVVQWDPYWQINETLSGVTGQWNVWVVSNPGSTWLFSNPGPSVSPSPSPNLGSNYAGWDGIGTGAFQPRPGDLIEITVTYDPSTNTLSGVATDLDTGQSASFTLNLGSYYTPPSSGNYVFGVGAGTYGGYADWALLYAAITLQLPSLAVQVFNTPNSPATSVPGVVYGVLYSSTGFSEVAFMNSSGYLNFNGVPSGTYTLEVYHYPNTGLNLTEYWGSETINVQPGYNTATFTRGEPWIYGLHPVRVNGQAIIDVTINNPLKTTLGAYVYLWVTTNPSTVNPNQPTATTQPITLNPGLNNYTFYYPASQAGTYHVCAALLTYNGTRYIVTGQWDCATIQPPNYSVVFRETGLPPGVAWNVTLGGVTESSRNSSIIFTVSKGEYYYSVASPILIDGTEYIASEPNGTVTINNNDVIVTIDYMPVNTINTTNTITLLTWVVAIMLIIAILMRKRPGKQRPSKGTGTDVYR